MSGIVYNFIPTTEFRCEPSYIATEILLAQLNQKLDELDGLLRERVKYWEIVFARIKKPPRKGFCPRGKRELIAMLPGETTKEIMARTGVEYRTARRGFHRGYLYRRMAPTVIG